MDKTVDARRRFDKPGRGATFAFTLGMLAVSLTIFPSSQQARTAEESRPILHLYTEGKGEICSIDPDGSNRTCLTDNRRYDYDAVWSPDGTRVTFVEQTNNPRNPDIYVMDATGEHKRRLTRSRLDDEGPDWSPDGTRIVWSRNRGDSPTGRLYVMAADGSGKRLVAGGGDDMDGEWSPDGGEILFLSRDDCLDERCANHQLDVHVIDADGGDERNLTQSPRDEFAAVWSPDGSRIAVVRELGDEDAEIFLMDSDGSDVTQLTDAQGAAFAPAWSPDGTQIAFTEITDFENFETRVGVVDVADGETRILTDEDVGGAEPTWSPDGSLIAFTGHRPLGVHASYEIHTIRPDGSELRRLTRTQGDEADLVWGEN